MTQKRATHTDHMVKVRHCRNILERIEQAAAAHATNLDMQLYEGQSDTSEDWCARSQSSINHALARIKEGLSALEYRAQPCGKWWSPR